jgi:hypothetical protein
MNAQTSTPRLHTSSAAVRTCLAFTAAVLSTACAPIPTLRPVVVECQAPTASDRPGPALVGQAYGMAMTPMPLNSVQFGSTDAATSLAVQNLYAERVPSNIVQVSARLVSCLDVPTSVRVRTSFFRSDTAPSEEPSAWKTVFLEPRATALYRESSVSRDTSAYLIEIAKR